MNYKILILLVSFTLISQFAFTQLGETFDLERPEKYQEKIIGYEKTYTKKFKLPRKFIQNTISHYNFFFNANEKLKNVFLAAKEAHKDTFDQLLSYYPYTFDYTKTLKNDLDSVIQKASGGILIHDLRTNWVDNFYLLIGKSYLLQQKYDSAEMTFNYINYEYAPKNKDKERLLTGSTENDAASVFSISTKENNSITHKLFQRPPSRNESFLWMIRTHIENEDFGSASGLVQTLKNDPLFPKRLHNDLDEITGYLYYKQNIYDSAAHYLSKSLSMSTGKNDKARREFLAGQLYEMGNQPGLASEWYAKSIKHTLDPVMEVYARLNSLKIKKTDDPKIIDENIAALLKMGKKDAYTEYRDIIYYFAGKMEQERNNTEGAINNYVKSTQYSTTNVSQKNKSFLALADIAYKLKKYRFASNYYDSLQLGDPGLKNVDEITSRKGTLKQLVNYFETIAVEDSLQQVAAMIPDVRDDYLKKLLKRLRKEQGLKDDGATSFGAASQFGNDNPNLFEDTRGEWYFYNASVKTRGNNEFKRKWGTRPNIDNWRRAAAIGQTNVSGNNRPVTGTNNTSTSSSSGNSSISKKQVNELTIEALTKNLPLTEPELKISNDSIYSAMVEMGKLYHYELDDIPMAIETYEAILKRFGDYPKNGIVLYNLQLAYTKIGDQSNAKKVNDVLDKKYKDDPNIKQLNSNSTANSDKATKDYTDICNLFIEGKFSEAIEKKKKADELYGNTNLWTPQLLYIEAVYYTKERKDSLAINSLDVILRQYTTSPLALKAEKLKNVLSRRSVIEHELSNLVVKRNEDAPIVIDNTVIQPTPIKKDTLKTAPPTVTPPKNPVVVVPPAKDTAKPKPPVPAPPSKFSYKVDDNKEHYVVVVLNKVDNIFTNEARNAFVIFNRSSGKTLRVDNMNVDADIKLLVMQSFANAAEALNYTKFANSKAATEIVPWLAKEKYSIIPITEENLQMVIKNKSWDNYIQFLQATYPGKF